MFLNFCLLHFNLCIVCTQFSVCGAQVHMYTRHRVFVEVRIQLAGVGSVLPPCGFLESSSDYQTQWQFPFYHEPSSLLTLSEAVSLPKISLSNLNLISIILLQILRTGIIGALILGFPVESTLGFGMPILEPYFLPITS